MPDGGKSVVSTVICGLVIGVVLNCAFWAKFKSDLEFYREQRPAICVDGRRMGQGLIAATLGVDDKQRHKGMITMKCSFPVAVYPCYDEDIELGEWDGYCRTLSESVAFSEGSWPRRVEEDLDITCCERDCMGGDQCSASAWSCATGSCSAYDKSTRICAAKLRKDPYKCFTHADDPEAGVREDSAAFPAGWLIAGMLSAVALCGCVGFAGFAMLDEENCIGKTIMYILGCGIFMGAIWGVVAIIHAMQGPPDKKGIVESNYKDLAQATGINQTSVAAEAPPPEGMHWAIILLIVFGSICGVFVLMFICFFCIGFCKELGWSARAKAVDSMDQSARDSRLSIGDSVSLSEDCDEHDPEAKNGILKPGDIGIIDDFVAGERGVQVKKGNDLEGSCGTHCYMDRCLVIAEDDGLKKGVSNFSVFSGKSNRQIAKGKSREDLNNLVKTTSGISVGERIGHWCLNEAEDARSLARSLKGTKSQTSNAAPSNNGQNNSE